MAEKTEYIQVTLPKELAERLQAEAKAAGLDLPAYLAFLTQCRLGRLDPKAQDAARFMFSRHGPSLRKLAQ